MSDCCRTLPSPSQASSDTHIGNKTNDGTFDVDRLVQPTEQACILWHHISAFQTDRIWHCIKNYFSNCLVETLFVCPAYFRSPMIGLKTRPAFLRDIARMFFDVRIQIQLYLKANYDFLLSQYVRKLSLNSVLMFFSNEGDP